MKRILRFGLYAIQNLHYYMDKGFFSLYLRKAADLMKQIDVRKGRIPEDIIANCPRSLIINNRFLPGIRIDFFTEDKNIDLIILYRKHRILNNMSIKGTSTLEITVTDRHGNKQRFELCPKTSTQMSVRRSILLKESGNEVSALLPGFAMVDSIWLQNAGDIQFRKNNRKTIAFYGSSITHGCAASKPSLSYPNLLGELTGYHIENFGFSESAKGEPEVIRYIASLKPEVLILEFDHNASVKELEARHLDTYRLIRRDSDCWIIFMSRFSGGLSISEEEEQERIHIISSTYYFARKHNDRKVAFLPGNTVFGKDKDRYFIDGVHPNDDGMKMIADAIYKIMKDSGMIEPC